MSRFRFRHLRVRLGSQVRPRVNPAEGVRGPARREFNLGSAVVGSCQRPASFNFAGVGSHEWVTPTMPKVEWPSGIRRKTGTRKAQP